MSAPATENKEPPRRETFLARYPRKLKVGAVGGILALLLVVWIAGGSSAPEKLKKAIQTTHYAAITGADSKEAIANPSPASITQSPADSANTNTAEDAATADGNDSSSAFMTPAPAPGLTEDTPQGSLPRVSEDGRPPWQVYARPFDSGDKRPRVAIVVTDLGLARVPSDAAIDRLPPNVTLAFDSQSPVVGAWCARARQAGHETLLMLPMEPFDYPRSDPGPNTLLSNLPNTDNIQRLLVALSQATGYVGITTLSGSHFTTDPTKITPILDVLHQRGLMVFDSKIAPHSTIADLARDQHVPVAVDTLRLDQNLAPGALDESLSRLEQTARLTGKAVGITPPLPVVINHLGPWIKQLHRDGIALAPISAMVQ